jgi:hypothetical protein
MGMGISDLEYLISLKERGLLAKLSCICDIGATQLYLEKDTAYLKSFINKFAKDKCLHELPNSELTRIANLGHAKKMWEHMGYGYICVDTSNEVDALNLDLNFDEVPIDRRASAQLVMNMGTTEHVANQIQAFKIIHDLTAVDGLMYHNVPFQGYQTHGLVNYTPKFFWMLCRSNEYEFLDFSVQHSELKENIHPDIILSIKQTGNKVPDGKFVATTAGIRTLLRKKKNAGFVPPFDGHVQGELNGIPSNYFTKYTTYL